MRELHYEISIIKINNGYQSEPGIGAIHVFVNTGRERLIRSHSSARFSFELSGNSN